MFPHWYAVVQPFLLAIEPGPIIEIGVFDGSTTERLAEIAMDRNTVVNAVDPAPQFNVDEYERRFAGHFRFYREKSHDVLERVEPASAVLIDGDHNWYTVHGELTRLERVATSSGTHFPLVFFHDVEWPYARRDMYYEPDAIPPEWRRPWSRQGLRWGDRHLAPEGEGVDAGLAKAVEEGGPRNGVLTAIEDFMRESEIDLDLRIVSGSNGVGILASQNLLDAAPTVRDRWARLRSAEFLTDQTMRLAEVAMGASIAGAEARHRIERLEGELKRARAELAAAEAHA